MSDSIYQTFYLYQPRYIAALWITKGQA